MSKPLFFSALSLASLAGTSRSWSMPNFAPDDPSAGGGGSGNTPAPKPGDNPPTPDPLAAAKAELEKAQARIKALEGEVSASTARISELGEKAKAAELTAAERAELKALKDAQAKAEEARKRSEGQFDLLLREAAEKNAAEKARLEAEIAKRDAALATERKTSKLRALIPQFTGAEVDDVINALFRDSITVDAEGKFTIKGKDGTHPRNPTTALPMTVEEFVAAEINSRPYFKAVRPLGGSGSSNQTTGSAPDGKFTAEDIGKMTPEEYAKKRKEILKQVG